MEQQFCEYERRYGISTKLVTKEEMADFTSSSKYFGGVYRPDIGGIHPAKLLKEMESK